MSKIEEIWKDISGYEGLYQISNHGRVKSLARRIRNHSKNRLSKEIILKWYNNGRGKIGYVNYMLCKNSKYKNMSGHRLVAIAFIPNPENKPFVNHKNGNTLDNHVSNLEWVTCSENNFHAYRVLKIKHPAKGKYGQNFHGTKYIIYKYSLCGELLSEYYGINEASRETGLDNSSILKAAKGKIHTCGGFKWSLKRIKK